MRLPDPTTRRLAWRAAGIALIALAVLGVALPESARAAGDRSAAPIVRLQANRNVHPRDSVRVLVLRLSARTPVTISWGDGTRTRVRTRCSSRQAVRHPRSCGTMVRHSYARTGVYRILVSRRPNSAYRAVLHVANARTAAVTPPAAAGTAAALDWRIDMLAAVNALRRDAGLAPVELCSNLTSAAQDYATAMATQDHYGHQGLDGSQPWDRMSSHGYVWRGAGENIAGGFGSVSEVMAGWRASPGHYANIVNPSFTHLGVGRAANPSSTYRSYWVQDFGYGGSCPVIRANRGA